jgi:hypothetical protein
VTLEGEEGCPVEICRGLDPGLVKVQCAIIRIRNAHSLVIQIGKGPLSGSTCGHSLPRWDDISGPVVHETYSKVKRMSDWLRGKK